MGNTQVDDRFNKCLWDAKRNIDEAFSHLAEACALGRLMMEPDDCEFWETVAKEKASQASCIITACIDSQLKRHLEILRIKNR